MAINFDKLKEHLAPLMEGREDSSDLMDSIAALDEPEVDNQLLIDEAVGTAVAENEAKWNERYTNAFFTPPTEESNTADTAVTVVDTPGDYQILTEEDVFGPVK